jgi:ATP-dependent Lhr-like helicase
MAAEDLIAVVFPTRSPAPRTCGEREVPDHPFVNQTVHDCPHDAMDVEGLETCFARWKRASRDQHRDLTGPAAARRSDCAPYAFFDDAPLEERRTQAVMSRRWLDEESAAGLGRLDADAIARVKSEAWPSPVNADELHDGLLSLAFVTDQEVAERGEWKLFLSELGDQRRVTRLTLAGDGSTADANTAMWVAAERRPQFQAVFAQAERSPQIEAPEESPRAPGRARMQCGNRAQPPRGPGPTTVGALVRSVCAAARGDRGVAREARRGRLPRYAARLRPMRASRNGASARSRASTATPPTACARKSSPCRARLHRPLPLAARDSDRAAAGSRCAGGAHRSARRFRSARRGVGSGDPSARLDNYDSHLARRSVSRGRGSL